MKQEETTIIFEKIIFLILLKLSNFFLGKSTYLPQEMCLENWYSKKDYVFSQEHIRESILRHGDHLGLASLIRSSSYFDIKNTLFQSRLYQDSFEQAKYPWKLKFIYRMLELKFIDRRQGVVPLLINFLFIGTPKSWWRFKLYNYLKNVISHK